MSAERSRCQKALPILVPLVRVCHFAPIIAAALNLCGDVAFAQQQPQQSSSVVRYFHVSDFHVDLHYSIYGDPSSNCHKNESAAAASNFVLKQTLGLYGVNSFLCDSPPALIEAAIQAMRNVDPNPDFILWTGDSDPHLPEDMESTEGTIQAISFTTRTIRNGFPNTPLYPAMGNHDYYPADQAPASQNPVYTKLAEIWAQDLAPDAVGTLRSYGYYATPIQFGSQSVLLIALNTVLWFAPNRQTANLTDPGEQMRFLGQLLGRARSSNQKAIVIGHVPIGGWDRKERTIAARFNIQLVNYFTDYYNDVIIGVYFGHLHRDVFGLIKQKSARDEKNVGWYLAGASIVPWFGTNPGFKYFEADSLTGQIRRIRQYYLNLTAANSGMDNPTVWKLGYEWTVPSGQSFLAFLQTKVTNMRKTTAGFKQYLDEAFVKGATSDPGKYANYTRHLCAILNVDQTDFDKCMITGIRNDGWKVTAFCRNSLLLLIGLSIISLFC